MPKSKQPKRQELGSDELRALFSSLGLSAQTTERAVQMRCKLPAEGADEVRLSKRKGRPPRPPSP